MTKMVGHDKKTDSPIVAVVSTYPVIREGLAAMVSRAGFQVIAGDDLDLADHDGSLAVVIVDIGLSAVSITPWEPPYARNGAVPVIGFCAATDPIKIRTCLSAGYRGILTCRSAESGVAQAINKVLEGVIYVDPDIASGILNDLQLSKRGRSAAWGGQLTSRELDVFHQIGTGKGNRDIARDLGVSIKTVETHKENIKRKMGIKSNAELSAECVRSLGSPWR